MALTTKQLTDVCLLNDSNHKTCRYLKNDDLEPSKWYCCKLRENDKSKIDSRTKQLLKDCRDRGINPKTLNVAMGDNCSGYPLLKLIDQGYDVD